MTRIIASILLSMILAGKALAQDYEIRTLFNPGNKASGGYGAIGNKFTTIGDQYANLVEVYGGWFINHRFLIGVEVAALTNSLPVAPQHSSIPGVEMNYQFGQFGLMTEYTLWSHRVIHLTFHAMGGAGFTVQYQRNNWSDDSAWLDDQRYPHDTNWFTVVEPGVKIEMNITKWMRFSPGISYRAAFDSKSEGLTDKDLSGTSLNATLKFGRF